MKSLQAFWYCIKDDINHMDWGHLTKMLLLVIPCIVWDIFFLILENLYFVCQKIDEFGSKWIEENIR